MNILGINCFSHDTSAALIQDDKVVAFVEEERLNRKKHTRDFPNKSIEYCLRKAKIDISNVDYVGFTFKPGLDLARGLAAFLSHPSGWRLFGGQILFDIKLARKIGYFKKKYAYKGKIVKVGHHEAHAASSFFASSFKEAAILSIDRGGDYISTMLAKGKKNKITSLEVIRNPQSIGSLYTVVTQYLGFKPNSGEGKIMGLAPYGKDSYLDNFHKLIELNEDGTFKLDLSYFTYHKQGGYGVSDKFVELFGPPRKPESKMESRHEDIAWALQKITEEAAVNLANHLFKITQSKNLCLTGGVALNSVMNEVILRETPFEDVFIQPAANDAGCALGAALYIWHQILNNQRSYTMKQVYLGPSFEDEEVVKVIRKSNAPFRQIDNPAKEAAKLIAQGKIVGWFQERLEAGPRALGNRSILADPRRAEMKDILNSKVKHREGFRPFAPSVLEEEAPAYFENYYPTPFMLLVLPIKKDKQNKVAAVCHVDGTGRLQTVTKDENPLYWQLINEFKQISGVPMVVNTSFNVRGEPIVCTPKDALDCFLGTQMDYLIMGNYLIEK